MVPSTPRIAEKRVIHGSSGTINLRRLSFHPIWCQCANRDEVAAKQEGCVEPKRSAEQRCKFRRKSVVWPSLAGASGRPRLRPFRWALKRTSFFLASCHHRSNLRWRVSLWYALSLDNLRSDISLALLKFRLFASFSSFPTPFIPCDPDFCISNS
jgi:hypothetical protein